MVRDDTASRPDPKLPPFEDRCSSRHPLLRHQASVRLGESVDPRPPAEIAFRIRSKSDVLPRRAHSRAAPEFLPPGSQLKSEPGLTSENFGVNLNSARRSQIPPLTYQ